MTDMVRRMMGALVAEFEQTIIELNETKKARQQDQQRIQALFESSNDLIARERAAKARAERAEQRAYGLECANKQLIAHQLSQRDQIELAAARYARSVPIYPVADLSSLAPRQFVGRGDLSPSSPPDDSSMLTVMNGTIPMGTAFGKLGGAYFDPIEPAAVTVGGGFTVLPINIPIRELPRDLDKAA